MYIGGGGGGDDDDKWSTCSVQKIGDNMPPLGVYVRKNNSSDSHQPPTSLSASVGILTLR